jgi:hypothetical protein
MNVLTIPRAVAGAEYAALRLPLTVLESRVVSRYLEQDDRFRLGFEKALGTLDSTVGRALRDPDLTQRGRTLARRSDVLGKAVALEEKAAARKAKADDSLTSAKQEADRKRADAKQRAQTEAKELRDKQLAEHAAAEAKAEQTARARIDAVEQRTEVKLAQEQAALADQLEAVEARTQSRTAKPKAELKQAAELKADAERERETADRLAELAQSEKVARKG